MSVNPSGSSEVSYSDHDVHHIRHQLRTTGGEPNVESFPDVRQFEITERGLDPDELAQLRAMRVAVGTASAVDDPQSQSGSIAVEIGAGFNLSGTEFLTRSSDLTELIDADGDGDDDYRTVIKDTDEVGQLYSFATTLVPVATDSTDQFALAGQFVNNTEMFDFAELFGSGPYVDAADDFVSSIEIAEVNNIAKIGVDVIYSLYYDVDEVEGGRTRFGR